MLIIADDKIPFLKGVLEPFAEVRYLNGAAISPDDVKMADALIIRTRTHCNAALLRGSKVRFIATATIGFDHIDAEYCTANGIHWTNAPGCNAPSVAQYAASLLLCDAVKNKTPLKGRTLGVIGVGNVGSRVAETALILGMKVLLCDPPRQRGVDPVVAPDGKPLFGSKADFLPLERVLAESDYVTLHVPLIREGADRTVHLACNTFFQKAARKPFFINAARGEAADSAALKTALITRQIRGAALDVWEDEPDIDLELAGLLEYATPHIAGYSLDGKANGTAAAVNAIARFFHLEIKNFFPAGVMSPEHPVLDLSASVNPLFDAVTAAYDIRRDTADLRNSPDEFESLRGNYHLRREFFAYGFRRSPNLNSDTIDRLVRLGFRLLPSVSA